MLTAGILGAGRLGRALATRISARRPAAISDTDHAAAVSSAAAHGMTACGPVELGELCDVILVCVPPDQVAAAIAACATARPLFASLATSVRTAELTADPRMRGLAISGLKPVGQYVAIARGLPAVFVTADAGHAPLLQTVVGDVGRVLVVDQTTEDAVGQINRIATLAALCACAGLAQELLKQELTGDPALVRAAIGNVLVGTALDYPPDPANRYTSALLDVLAAERSAGEAPAKSPAVNAAAYRRPGVDGDGDPGLNS